MWTNRKVWELPFEPIQFDELLPRIKQFLSLITMEILFYVFLLASVASMVSVTINKQDVCWTSQMRFSIPFILGTLRPESSFKHASIELCASLVVLERRFHYAHFTAEHVFSFLLQLQDLICGAQWWRLGWSARSTAHWYVKGVLPLPSRCRSGSSRSPADRSDLPFFSGLLTVQHFCEEHLVLRYGLQTKFSFHLNHGAGPCVYLLIPDYGFQNLIDVFVSYLSTETWDNGLLTIDTDDKIRVAAVKTRHCFIVEAGALQQCKFMWSLIVSLLTFY